MIVGSQAWRRCFCQIHWIFVKGTNPVANVGAMRSWFAYGVTDGLPLPKPLNPHSADLGGTVPLFLLSSSQSNTQTSKTRQFFRDHQSEKTADIKEHTCISIIWLPQQWRVETSPGSSKNPSTVHIRPERIHRYHLIVDPSFGLSTARHSTIQEKVVCPTSLGGANLIIIFYLLRHCLMRRKAIVDDDATHHRS